MTGGVPTDDELLAYMKRIHEDELAGSRMQVPFGPYTALVTIGALQLAMRHPAMEPNQLRDLTLVVDGFRPWFAGTLGERIIDMGNDPAMDKSQFPTAAWIAVWQCPACEVELELFSGAPLPDELPCDCEETYQHVRGLTPVAIATLSMAGITPEQWVEANSYGDVGDGKWRGDICGCSDDRCANGFHHAGVSDCQCLPVLIEEYHAGRLG